MATEPSKTLTKRSAENSLMPPPPPPKRIKRPATVLDEDTYTGALSHIIARDFFPGLLESQTQQEYLDAVESKDKEWINEAGRKLSQIMTPGPEGRRLRSRRGVTMTPLPQTGDETPRGWGGDTPASVAPSDASTKDESKSDVNLNLSLSKFQEKYTSEDNESFNELLDKQNAKKAEKYNWLYAGNKIPSGRQIAYRERQAKLLESSKEKTSSTSQELIKRNTDLDSRPAMPDIRPSQQRNAFMFEPDSIEDTHLTTAQEAQAKSNAGPKAVIHDNTRLPPPPSQTASIPPSPSLSAINDAIAGRPHPTASESGYDGSATPRVGGYAFVDENPTPAELGQRSSPSPPPDLLKQLGAEAGGPNPFHLAAASKRESLHHAMVEKTARSKRAGGRVESLKANGAVGKTPVPKFLSATPRAGGAGAGELTPAAQSLLGKVGTPVRGEVMANVFGKTKERERWTPKVALTPRGGRRQVG